MQFEVILDELHFGARKSLDTDILVLKKTINGTNFDFSLKSLSLKIGHFFGCSVHYQ